MRSMTLVITITGLFGAFHVLKEQPEFRMYPALRYTDELAEVQIIGGTKADPDDWPATFVFEKPDGHHCTSTAVGPRVILTAAHCIPDGARGTVELSGQSTEATCSRHPDFHDNVSLLDPQREQKVSPDFALCLVREEMRDLEFENVDVVGDALRQGLELRLLGFGCNSAGGSDGGYGVLYEGDSPIDELPTSTSYYTKTDTGAAICFGDSGGGVHHVEHPRRWLVAVNSATDSKSRSLLSTTSVGGFVDWARDWSSLHQVAMCGVHDSAERCRPL